MKIWILVALGLLNYVAIRVEADDYYWGSCPKVEPVPDFDFEKFSGLWYVIEKFDTSTPCLTFFFYNKNGTHKVLQSRNQIVDPLNPENTPGSIGILQTPNPTAPGFMRARFSDNIAGLSDYVVYYTDYTSYGGIYKCQKILVGNRQSAVILSRDPYMSRVNINQSRAKLISYNIEIRSLRPIDQNKCRFSQVGLDVLNSTFIGLGDISW